jgi:4-hydroxy-3-methylbut-2-enyl diphosphate reductase
MQVLRAEAMGFCFGVRDALAAAHAVTEPTAVTIHGELVHNASVLAELDGRGFVRSDEAARPLPATPQVLVTAHGISERERQRLLGAGKQLIDTTCPLVHKVHRIAQELQQQGRHVVVIGKAAHVEVLGIVEDLEHCTVISEPDEVGPLPAARIGIVCQTTVPIRLARRIAAAVRARNPGADVRFHDTVCEPTKQRQAAVERLLPRVDAFVVVGGRNSNNTRQLRRLCEQALVRVLQVEGPAELDPAWFSGCAVVGLTAGTSTPDATIAAVEAALLSIDAGRRAS